MSAPLTIVEEPSSPTVGEFHIGDIVVTNQNVVREVRRIEPDFRCGLSVDGIEIETDATWWVDEHGEEWWANDIVEVRTPHAVEIPLEFGEHADTPAPDTTLEWTAA